MSAMDVDIRSVDADGEVDRMSLDLMNFSFARNGNSGSVSVHNLTPSIDFNSEMFTLAQEDAGVDQNQLNFFPFENTEEAPPIDFATATLGLTTDVMFTHGIEPFDVNDDFGFFLGSSNAQAQQARTASSTSSASPQPKEIQQPLLPFGNDGISITHDDWQRPYECITEAFFSTDMDSNPLCSSVPDATPLPLSSNVIPSSSSSTSGGNKVGKGGRAKKAKKTVEKMQNEPLKTMKKKKGSNSQRIAHNQMEKKRRVQINSLVGELQKQVPSVQDVDKPSTVNVLREARNYVLVLQKEDYLWTQSYELAKKRRAEILAEIARYRDLENQQQSCAQLFGPSA